MIEFSLHKKGHSFRPLELSRNRKPSTKEVIRIILAFRLNQPREVASKPAMKDLLVCSMAFCIKIVYVAALFDQLWSKRAIAVLHECFVKSEGGGSSLLRKGWIGPVCHLDEVVTLVRKEKNQNPR